MDGENLTENQVENSENLEGHVENDELVWGDVVEKKIEELENKVEFLIGFCKMQSSINNVMRFLVRKKYSENELNEALKEFEEHEKHLKESENEEKKEEN